MLLLLGEGAELRLHVGILKFHSPLQELAVDVSSLHSDHGTWVSRPKHHPVLLEQRQMEKWNRVELRVMGSRAGASKCPPQQLCVFHTHTKFFFSQPSSSLHFPAIINNLSLIIFSSPVLFLPQLCSNLLFLVPQRQSWLCTESQVGALPAL